MKKLIIAMAVAVFWNAAAYAAGTLYELRVDGLACPYCAEELHFLGLRRRTGQKRAGEGRNGEFRHDFHGSVSLSE